MRSVMVLPFSPELKKDSGKEALARSAYRFFPSPSSIPRAAGTNGSVGSGPNSEVVTKAS